MKQYQWVTLHSVTCLPKTNGGVSNTGISSLYEAWQAQHSSQLSLVDSGMTSGGGTLADLVLLSREQRDWGMLRS
jgi:hypothetical protein